MPPPVLLRRLRAAGEPSRLRLLALCEAATLSVSDLARVLGQSEARVSRHLKILSEAGLIERLPQGQWVQYRLAGEADAAGFARGLLAQLDRRDPGLQRDLGAVRAAARAPGSLHGGESRLGRALVGFVSSSAPEEAAPESTLIVGGAHLELIEHAARSGGDCTVLVPSRRAAQAVRAFAERRALACQVLKAASAEAPRRSDFVRAGDSFAAVILDVAGAGGEALARIISEASRVLAPGGRLWLFEPYEALESASGRIVEHPLARLRRLLGSTGLSCERLSPVEADGEHVLAALARSAAAA
ncbi:MAG: metalloregulator ArsR/SmtB family transcription factor, partial [Gammaproteobacteria bacterium]|nr:metalloregulator ArsR/SmtB family transcription factor [Gammaproteobacteria bacterium]